MAKNNEKQAKVKETTQASIEFSDIQGHDTNGTYAIKIVPEKLNLNPAKADIDVNIFYYSEGKIAHFEDEYIGEYEIKANIYGTLVLDIKDFMEAMQKNRKSLGDATILAFKVNNVEITDLNPIHTSNSNNVSLETIKSKLIQKFMNTSSDIFMDSELRIDVLQQNMSVENC